MRITVTEADGMSVVRFEGDLRIASVADAKPELVAVLASRGGIQFDLSALGECDTAGIQLLLMACTSARAKGKRCITLSHTAAFRTALDRVGIPVECFELQTVAFDNS
jgi:anti-sigma B factor antagonist